MKYQYRKNKQRKHLKNKGHRRAGILWDYNGDGRYAAERVKGKDKRYWRRWNRRIHQGYSEEAQQEILSRFAMKMACSKNITLPEMEAEEYWEM